MADFCLGPHAIIGITRQVHPMDRMCEWAGIPGDRRRKGSIEDGEKRLVAP